MVSQNVKIYHLGNKQEQLKLSCYVDAYRELKKEIKFLDFLFYTNTKMVLELKF